MGLGRNNEGTLVPLDLSKTSQTPLCHHGLGRRAEQLARRKERAGKKKRESMEDPAIRSERRRAARMERKMQREKRKALISSSTLELVMSNSSTISGSVLISDASGRPQISTEAALILTKRISRVLEKPTTTLVDLQALDGEASEQQKQLERGIKELKLYLKVNRKDFGVDLIGSIQRDISYAVSDFKKLVGSVSALRQKITKSKQMRQMTQF